MLYIFTVFVLHTALSQIAQLYLVVLLLIAVFSKKNAFWFALILIISETQTFVLSFAHKQSLLPTFNILPGGLRNLYFEEIFLYLFFLKALLKGNFKAFFFQKPLQLLGIYYVLLVVISLGMGVSGIKFFATLRNFMGYTFFFSIPVLFAKKNEYDKFFRYIFPVIFLVLGIQILELVVGTRISFAINEEEAQLYDNIVIDPEKRVARQLYAQNMVVLIFIGAMYYLSVFKTSLFKRNYLFGIMAACVLSAFLSATRGYIMSLLVGLLLFVIFERHMIRNVLNYGIIALIFFLILANIPKVNVQLVEAFQRFTTIGLLVEGDLTAGGTLKRITERAPPMLEKFYERPIFGWAFSDTFHIYADKHVGHVYMLLNGGIVGYGLFTVFFLYFIINLYKRYKNCHKRNVYKYSSLTMIAGFFMFYTFHSTSVSFFRYTIGFNGLVMSLVMFFVFSDYVYKISRNEEIKIKQALKNRKGNEQFVA